MSAERQARRRRQREARKMAVRAARAQGCTCHVESQVVDGAVALLHDDWCPLLRVIEERPPGLARSQAVIYRPEAP